MDLITQGLLGAAIAEAGWRKKLGRGAIAAGVLFGLMPDFDVIAGAWGPWASMVHHRGFTHSIFFAPLMAPVAGVLAQRLSKRGEARSWAHLIFWVLLTHPLLDVFTTYGTQLLTPVSNHRFALDGVSIIDPIYTVPLLVALVIARIWRARPQVGQRAAAAALLFTTSYLGMGYLQASASREAAAQQLTAREYPEMEEVRATPTFANLLLWRIVARDRSGDLHVGLYSRAAPGEIRFETLTRPETPLIPRALEDERAQIFHWFAQDMVSYRVKEDGEQTALMMDDQRYGGITRPTRSFWGARAVFDAEQELVTVERVREPGARGDVGEELRTLWRYIWEGPPGPEGSVVSHATH